MPHRFLGVHSTPACGSFVPGPVVAPASRRKDPAERASWMGRARAEEASRTWARAVWSYSRASEARPGDTAAQAGYDRTLGFYNKERAAQYFRWGREAESRGFLLEAQRQYDGAAQLDPSDPAIAAARMRLKALVSSSASAGATADPRVVALLKEAASLSAQGKREEALASLKKARALYPDDKALDDFEKSMTALPTPAPAAKGPDPVVERLLTESEIYLRKGRSDLARDTWKRVLEVDPHNTDVQDKLRSVTAGAPAVKAVSHEDQARAQSLYEKGLKAYLAGYTQKAVDDWEAALSLDPSHMDALNNLVRARLELSRPEGIPLQREGSSP